MITLDEHLRANGGEKYAPTMARIAIAGKVIANAIANEVHLGHTGEVNVHGDSVMRLDRFADDTIHGLLMSCSDVYGIGSEERVEVTTKQVRTLEDKLTVYYDPLDGSSNIDYDVTVGSIFGIYEAMVPLSAGCRPAAAAYLVYGPNTILVYSIGVGVHSFVYNRSLGEFVLSQRDIKIPEKPKFYSLNSGYEKDWRPGIARFARWLRGVGSFGDKKAPSMKVRWVASLVADFHRNLLAGGVHVSHETMLDGRLDGKKPKLRLMYEAAPLAFIAEQAGGAAVDGKRDILDIAPADPHQKTTLIIGSKDLVKTAQDMVLSERDMPEVKHERLVQYDEALKYILELAKDRDSCDDPESLYDKLKTIETYVTNKLNWDNDEWTGGAYEEK
jgi:fructose-1,6-bisphosphatase I